MNNIYFLGEFNFEKNLPKNINNNENCDFFYNKNFS